LAENELLVTTQNSLLASNNKYYDQLAGAQFSWEESIQKSFSLGHVLLRLGTIRGSMVITLVSVVMSWLITAVVMLVYQMEESYMVAAIISTVCPLLIAPPVSYAILNLLVWLKHAEQMARQLAQLDPLTGVLNRTFFFRRIRQLLQNNSNSTPLSLLLIDLDFFKSVNDQLGHVEGDRVLIQVCQCVNVRREFAMNALRK
jgi:predicted signal transduction protein with EAL and GGDEF domain